MLHQTVNIFTLICLTAFRPVISAENSASEIDWSKPESIDPLQKEIGDGCDELLIAQEPFTPYENNAEDFVNRVELYFGGEEMSEEPGMIFGPYNGFEGVGVDLCFLGNLTGNGSVDFAIKSNLYEKNVDLPYTWKLYIYQGGETLDTIPDFVLERKTAYETDKPCDINGDGFNDMILRSRSGDLGQIEIYYGGEDFDLEVDDVITNEAAGLYFGNSKLLSGFDLNGDGIGDIVLRGNSYGGLGDIRLYFGSYWVEERYAILISPIEIEDLSGIENTQGAYADFNGDGAGDFCILAQPLFNAPRKAPPRMAIYAGNPDWELKVPFEPVSPESYKLTISAQPNPFNNKTRISFEIPFSGSLHVNVYNTNGRLITSTEKQNLPVGWHGWNLEGDSLAAGVYFLRAQLESGTQVQRASIKLVYLR